MKKVMRAKEHYHLLRISFALDTKVSKTSHFILLYSHCYGSNLNSFRSFVKCLLKLTNRVYIEILTQLCQIWKFYLLYYPWKSQNYILTEFPYRNRTLFQWRKIKIHKVSEYFFRYTALWFLETWPKSSSK